MEDLTATKRFSFYRKSLFTLTVFIILFLNSITLATATELTQSNVLTNGAGKFVFGQISGFGVHQYLLDTESGKLWNLMKDSEGENILVPVRFYDYQSLPPEGKNTIRIKSKYSENSEDWFEPVEVK